MVADNPPRYLPSGAAPGGSSIPPRQNPYRYATGPEDIPPRLDNSGFEPSRPYTFDPLFVEDPLNVGNNVGRNAFRIFQVQRAFSDAHRTLVASLEWDMHSSDPVEDDDEYPLLKCLLHKEDAMIDL
jgi:hypothetical protein